MVSTATANDTTSTLFAPPDLAGDQVTSERLNRSQVIERIMAHNPTANVEFLEDFSESALRTYLDHLISAQRPRGRMARWVRPGDTPGIVMAEPRD